LACDLNKWKILFNNASTAEFEIAYVNNGLNRRFSAVLGDTHFYCITANSNKIHCSFGFGLFADFLLHIGD
jgi:hypothetical protein